MKHLNFSLYDKFVKFVNCVTQFLKVPKCQSVTTFLKRLMGYGLPVTGASGTDEVTLFPRVLSRIVSTQSRFALVLPLLFAFVKAVAVYSPHTRG